MAIGIPAAVFLPDLISGGTSAHITSRTPGCEQDLQDALAALQADMGLPFEITGTEPDTLFTEGVLEKTYARDGSRFDLSFHLENDAGQCQLVLYKRCVREPGSITCTHATFGAINMTECACE